uniref:Uncharacterized protein n=1 Tax=Arundo donax TaxID=35708 RepID=A0A0A9FCS0_ARUDO
MTMLIPADTDCHISNTCQCHILHQHKAISNS